MKQVFGVVILFCLLSVSATNLYETCSNSFATSTSWYYIPYYTYDAAPLALPHYLYYTTNFTQGEFYFNFCAPIDICNGGLACFRTEKGVIVPVAFPWSNVYYYGNSNYFSIQYHTHTTVGSCSNTYFSIDLQCGGSEAVTVISSTAEYCSVNLQIESSTLGCHLLPLDYVNPTYYSFLSASIYLRGRLPMFTLDAVSDAGETSFIGTMYYSVQYQSILLNGTLSNSKNQQSSVAYLYQGVADDFSNPATVYTYVKPETSSTHQCILLANQERSSIDWFSTSANRNMGPERQYTTIFFNPGTTFSVRTYYQYEPYLTLMQRVDDKRPIFIGGYFLSPFVDFGESGPGYISEINWNTIKTSALPSSLFYPPASWDCY